MMNQIVNELRKQYPIGTRVELIKMNDIQAPEIGTRGTVRGVDDIGSILVSWDNGSGLNVVYGEDEVKIVTTVTTICYGKKKEWQNRKDAVEFFTNCYYSSEGAEKERYANILTDLSNGFDVCKDVIEY